MISENIYITGDPKPSQTLLQQLRNISCGFVILRTHWHLGSEKTPQPVNCWFFDHPLGRLTRDSILTSNCHLKTLLSGKADLSAPAVKGYPLHIPGTTQAILITSSLHIHAQLLCKQTVDTIPVFKPQLWTDSSLVNQILHFTLFHRHSSSFKILIRTVFDRKNHEKRSEYRDFLWKIMNNGGCSLPIRTIFDAKVRLLGIASTACANQLVQLLSTKKRPKSREPSRYRNTLWRQLFLTPNALYFWNFEMGRPTFYQTRITLGWHSRVVEVIHNREGLWYSACLGPMCEAAWVRHLRPRLSEPPCQVWCQLVHKHYMVSVTVIGHHNIKLKCNTHTEKMDVVQISYLGAGPLTQKHYSTLKPFQGNTLITFCTEQTN